MPPRSAAGAASRRGGGAGRRVIGNARRRAVGARRMFPRLFHGAIGHPASAHRAGDHRQSPAEAGRPSAWSRRRRTRKRRAEQPFPRPRAQEGHRSRSSRRAAKGSGVAHDPRVAPPGRPSGSAADRATRRDRPPTHPLLIQRIRRGMRPRARAGIPRCLSASRGPFRGRSAFRVSRGGALSLRPGRGRLRRADGNSTAAGGDGLAEAGARPAVRAAARAPHTGADGRRRPLLPAAPSPPGRGGRPRSPRTAGYRSVRERVADAAAVCRGGARA